MGRIVKGASVKREAYQLTVPVARNGASNGHIDPADVLDIFAAHAPAPPEPPPAPTELPIDWAAFYERAAELLERAQADAASIVETAGDDAKALLAQAASQIDEIHEAARAQGRNEGFSAGRAAADTEMEEMLQTMRGLIDMARIERHKILQSAEPELVRLAMGIAERVIHTRVEADPTIVVSMAKEALSRLVDRESITVRVNPSDLEQMREHRENLLALGDVKDMRVIEDQRVDRGGVLVETEAGSVDAKISSQIVEVRRVLHLDDDDDDIVVSPAADGDGDDAAVMPAAALG